MGNGLIGSIILGILAGYIAGRIMKGGGFGCLWNLVLGIVGSFVGGFLFGLLHIAEPVGFIGQLVMAVIGAVVVLWLAAKLRK